MCSDVRGMKGANEAIESKKYKEIRLLNIAYKILACILSEGLKPYVIRIILLYQCDLMPGKSANTNSRNNIRETDSIFILISDKRNHDTVNRDELLRATYDK
ncbi:hypothetical protein ACFFRR_006147 [Megaselia abdita]